MRDREFNINELLTPKDIFECERLAKDRARAGSRQHFEETVARCEANAIIARPFDEAYSAMVMLTERAAHLDDQLRRSERKVKALRLALWAATGFAALMAIVAACAILWR